MRQHFKRSEQPKRTSHGIKGFRLLQHVGKKKHDEVEEEEHTVQLQSEDKHYQQKELSEFMKLMVGYWEQNIGKIFTKQKDLNIANAVIELFRNSDRIDAFNKKALYLYIREISNCKTQQITKIINRMKQFYVGLVKSYKTYGTISNVMV